MNCAECGSEVGVYCLEQRSSNLYLYLCEKCMKAFLAHHFDLDLEAYKLEELEVRCSDGLFFIRGLEVEPRVFDFEIDGGGKALLVVDGECALGELALGRGIFASYSDRAKRRLQRHLECGSEGECDLKCFAERVEALWNAAGGK